MPRTIKRWNDGVIWMGLTIFCHFTIGGLALNAADTDAEKISDWPKAAGAVFALRNTHFSTPRITLDSKGRDLMAFECAPRGHAHIGRFYDLVCDGGSFLMKDVGQWIGAQIEKSGAFTLEIMLKPTEFSPTKRGVVLAYCDEKGEEVAIYQDQKGLAFRLGNAEPFQLFAPANNTPVHLLIACDKEKWTAYRDGLPVCSGLLPAGMPVWSTRNLMIGSTGSGSDAWRGRVEDIAVFSRALSAAEAKNEAAASRALQTDRKPASALRFKGTLLRQAITSDVAQIRPYTRSLSAAEYKIEKVLEGNWKEPTVTVFHWMILDGKRLPIADRKPGEVVELRVENLSEHQQLESCRRDEIEGDVGAEFFYQETNPQ